MEFSQNTNLMNQNLPKWIFILVSVAILIIMPTISHLYGINGDEDLEFLYGRDAYEYYANGSPNALSYQNHKLGKHIAGVEMYGCMVPLMAEATHRWFGTNIIDTRHFYISLFGVALMIFTGLFAYRISKRNWWVGLLALLFMVFCPRIFGESMENGKDIPFATGMIMGICGFYFLLYALKENGKRKWLHFLVMAIGTSIAFSSRPGGAPILYGIFGLGTILMLYQDKEMRAAVLSKAKKKQFFGMLIGAALLGYGIAVVFWPYVQSNPIGNLIASIKEMSNRDVNFRVYFEGKYFHTKNTPDSYVLKWIFITNSLLVLAAFLGFIIVSRKAIKQWGISPIVTVLFMAIFPFVYIYIKKSTIYDTWRHVFFVFPFWATAAALFVQYISTLIKNEKYKLVPFAVAVLGLVPEIAWTFTTTPYQHMYFNALVGGIKGAEGHYDLDYYQTSNREMAEWIIKNGKPRVPGEKIKVLSTMEGLYTVDDSYYEGYFEKYKDKIDGRYGRYYERFSKDWDYFVTYNRFLSEWQLLNHKFPACNAVYEVKVKGVTIAAIYHRKTDFAYQAFQAFEKKDFAQAAALYEKAATEDKLCDENELFYYGVALAQSGNLDKGIEQVIKATEMDGGRDDFYLALAQMYQMKGDKTNAQKAQRTANNLKAERLANQ